MQVDFETRAAAAATAIPASHTAICIGRHSSDRPFAPTWYVRGADSPGLPFLDASAQSWMIASEQEVSADAFGAYGDLSGANHDDTAALAAFFAFIGAGHGRRGRLRGGANYRVWPTAAAGGVEPLDPICNLSARSGFTIDFSGARITAQYEFVPNQQPDLFRFANCHHFRLIAPDLESFVTDNPGYGLFHMRFRDGCSHFAVINPRLRGGKSGIICGIEGSDLAAVTANPRCHHLVVTGADIEHVFYGVTLRWSGDNSRIDLKTRFCGRGVFVYNVLRDVQIWQDNEDASLVGALIGVWSLPDRVNVTNDIELFYTSRANSTPVFDQHVQMVIQPQTLANLPASFSNIRVHLDINKQGDGSGGGTQPQRTGFSITKQKCVDLGGGMLGHEADTLGRGHTILNCSVDGRIEGTGAHNSFEWTFGYGDTNAGGLGDSVAGLKIGPLTLFNNTGGQANLWLKNVKGGCLIENLISDRPLNVASLPPLNSGVVSFVNVDSTTFKSQGANANGRWSWESNGLLKQMINKLLPAGTSQAPLPQPWFEGMVGGHASLAAAAGGAVTFGVTPNLDPPPAGPLTTLDLLNTDAGARNAHITVWGR